MIPTRSWFGHERQNRKLKEAREYRDGPCLVVAEVMKEAGVDISGQESTVVTDQMLQGADIVVTVCGHADELCPALPPGVKKRHWPLADPARATGSEEEIMAALAAGYDVPFARVSPKVADPSLDGASM